MPSSPAAPRSGDGSRPTTAGGVDNIGAGKKFDTARTATGEQASGPGPKQRMGDKRKDVASSKQDDSTPLDLNADLQPTPNENTPPTPPEPD